MAVKRGEIWLASLPEPRGAEPGYRRPVVVVSSDHFNESRINTLLAAVITSNLRLAEAPGNIFLPKKLSGLSNDSVINISQVITLDKSFLTEKISKLNSQQLIELNDGLRLVLAL